MSWQTDFQAHFISTVVVDYKGWTLTYISHSQLFEVCVRTHDR
jgi:hypothetical protein